ncbi:MAG: glycerophosphodiester phosphodiesterase family protein [Alphaproteobacteria bacterium]
MKIVCHRGFNHLAPENTLAAATLCFERGYDFVELDLQTTSDGRLVNFHDAALNRTTNGGGKLTETSWADLSRLDAGSWFDPRYADQRVPLFSDMLALARDMGGGLYAELKAVEPAAMLAEVRAAGMMARCFFGSEIPAYMREVRALAPEAVLMARRRDFQTFDETVRDASSQIVEFDQTVDDLSEVALCREAGVEAMIYDRTHERAEMERLFDLGPDIVNVDRPDIAAEVRDARR